MGSPRIAAAVAVGRFALQVMPQADQLRVLPERPPEVGELLQVRSRRWLVEEVTPSEIPGASPVVTLACADDDVQGQALRVFWDWAHLTERRFDDPTPVRGVPVHLRWHCVTATDANLFQAPFRGGPDRRLPDGAAPEGATAATSQPVHRRRHGAGQDHRGGADRPRAATAPEGEDERGRGAAVRSGAVEGGTGGSLRTGVRDPGPLLPGPDASRAGLSA